MSTEFAFLSSKGIPVGSILAFAGEINRIPKGWLVCDGSVLKNTDYPNLFKAIGTVWGGAGTPNFYLPDLRGMFLRGVSGESKNDPDKDLRTSPQAGSSPANPGNNGNNVGSVQSHQIFSHKHSASAIVDRNNINGTNGTHDGDGGGQKWNSDPGYGAINVRVSIDNYGGNETRPINVYVFYMIKVDD